VRRLRAAEITRSKATSSHGFGVASALLLAQTLGCAASRIEWVGVEAGPRRPGAPLSAAVLRALPEAAALALALASEIADLDARS
jgi:Ni,Fe-hydrogenase maturation factor